MPDILKDSEGGDGAADGAEIFQKGGELSEGQHVGSVAFRVCGIGMGFEEESVNSHCYTRAGYGLYHLGLSAGDTPGLVRLLQGVGGIEYDGSAE